nr:RNA-directed DNA polymerase, eukaryota [Tanacetum cinerariifolium]
MGDFNDVRCKEERLGSLFNSLSARVFNRFLESARLVEVKVEGYSFTWSHPSAAKMSKLDRFLVTDGILLLFPSITALCLDWHLSDHRPILLHEVHTDFGPIPFRFYHSWFRLDGFDYMMEHGWRSFSHSDSNGMIRFKKKLQDLKIIIRRWVKDRKSQQFGVKNTLISELRDIEKALNQGNVSDTVLRDENSKFFHGIINKKRSQLSIRGVFVDGLWCTDPCKVKETFRNHIQARFNQPSLGRFKLNSVFTNRLSPDQVVDLDSNVSRDEIRKAVWDCGENRSPGPDGYTFEFFGNFRALLGWIFVALLSIFLSTVISRRGTFSRPLGSARIGVDGSAVPSLLLGPRSWLTGVQREWSESNLKSIVTILNCFFLASGLKINIQKSQLLGVGVPRSSVAQAAAKIGCAVLHHQFRYLGVMVGECMSRRSAWDGLVHKLRFWLSKWKVKTLSIGGRLTLLKSVLEASLLYNMSIFKAPKGVLKDMEAIRSKFFNGADSSERKITWIAWKKVLAAKKNGGLDGSLWFKVIQAMYGDSLVSHPCNQAFIWCSILREVNLLKAKGFDFISHCKKQVGDDMDKEVSVAGKLGSVSLDVSFRRGVRDGAERQQWDDLISLVGSVSLSSSKDRWICDLSTSCLRAGGHQLPQKHAVDQVKRKSGSSNPGPGLVSQCCLGDGEFRVKERARRDCLPTRHNLSRRGILLDSVLCPLCDAAVEDSQHVFFSCDIAQDVFRSICRWWDLDGQVLSTFSDWQVWFLSLRLLSSIKALLKGFFVSLGGIFGCFGIALFSRLLLRDVR